MDGAKGATDTPSDKDGAFGTGHDPNKIIGVRVVERDMRTAYEPQGALFDLVKTELRDALFEVDNAKDLRDVARRCATHLLLPFGYTGDEYFWRDHYPIPSKTERDAWRMEVENGETFWFNGRVFYKSERASDSGLRDGQYHPPQPGTVAEPGENGGWLKALSDNAEDRLSASWTRFASEPDADPHSLFDTMDCWLVSPHEGAAELVAVLMSGLSYHMGDVHFAKSHSRKDGVTKVQLLKNKKWIRIENCLLAARDYGGTISPIHLNARPNEKRLVSGGWRIPRALYKRPGIGREQCAAMLLRTAAMGSSEDMGETIAGCALGIGDEERRVSFPVDGWAKRIQGLEEGQITPEGVHDGWAFERRGKCVARATTQWQMQAREHIGVVETGEAMAKMWEAAPGDNEYVEMPVDSDIFVHYVDKALGGRRAVHIPYCGVFDAADVRYAFNGQDRVRIALRNTGKWRERDSSRPIFVRHRSAESKVEVVVTPLKTFELDGDFQLEDNRAFDAARGMSNVTPMRPEYMEAAGLQGTAERERVTDESERASKLLLSDDYGDASRLLMPENDEASARDESPGESFEREPYKDAGPEDVGEGDRNDGRIGRDPSDKEAVSESRGFAVESEAWYAERTGGRVAASERPSVSAGQEQTVPQESPRSHEGSAEETSVEVPQLERANEETARMPEDDMTTGAQEGAEDPSLSGLTFLSRPVAIEQLLSRFEHNEILLDVGFRERRYSGSVLRRGRLVESIVLGVPLAGVYVQEQADGVWGVIDGAWRLETIRAFADGEFRLEGLRHLRSIEGLCFGDLSRKLVRELQESQVVVHVLRGTVADNVLSDLFQRLNNAV